MMALEDDQACAFEVELGSGITLRLDDSQARWLNSDKAVLEAGASIAAIGKAPPPGKQLQAILVATGVHGEELLDHTLASRANETDLGEPPYPVQVLWAARPGEPDLPWRLHIFHRPREVTDKLRGPAALLLALLIVGFLSLTSGSYERALELFNTAAPWVICPLPFILFVVVMARAGGREIVVDEDRLRCSYDPFRWRPGWNVPTSRIARISRAENSLWVELAEGDEPRPLLPEGTPEQLDYVQSVVARMVSEGPGGWIDLNRDWEAYGGRLWTNILMGLLLAPMVLLVILLYAS
jgi:hypothetical protein